MKFVFCVFIFNVFLNSAYAEKSDRGIGFYLDQDMLLPLFNEDRDYTMGLALEFFWAKEDGLYPLDGLVQKTGKWLGLKDLHNDFVYSFMVGTVVFTPDDLGEPSPIFDDRPYSSLIYLSNKRVRADDEKAVGVEVLVGILGTNIANEVQTALHTWYRGIGDTDEPVNPEGWEHQISDGGELTMRFRLSSSELLKQSSKPEKWDVATSWGLSLGYQTNANVGIAIRGGNIKSHFWSLPFDPINRDNFLPSSPQSEWYAWSAFRAHLVVYDVLLQGQFRDSDVTFSSDDIERIVFDGAIGLTKGFEESQVTFSVNMKSPELKISNRNHAWAGISYLYHF